MAEVKVDITKDLAPKFTITVRIIGIKSFRIRLWIAKQLIKLATLIINTKVKFEKAPWYGADL